MPQAHGWAAVGASAALAALWAAFGELEMLAAAIFLGLATFLGVVFVRLVSPRVQVTRRIFPAQVHQGQQVSVEVGLVTARRARNLSLLEDAVHGLGTARFAAGVTSPGHPLTARYDVQCSARGVFQVGPAQVSVTDPFGLAEIRRPRGNIDHLVVYPRVEPLCGYPAVRGVDPRVQSTRPTFSPRGGEDFFTLREYQIGDDLRKVHWPSTAKRDQLMIRQLEIPWQARALVLLDRRAEVYPTEDHFEQAVRGAASVVAHLHTGGYRPELWTGEPTSGLAHRTGYDHAMEMLAAVQPLAHLDLAHAVYRLRRTGLGGGALVLVTGTPDEGVLGAFRTLAGSFARTVALVTEDEPGQARQALGRAGVVTVAAPPGAPWALAWRSAMEGTWSTATAG